MLEQEFSKLADCDSRTTIFDVYQEQIQDERGT